MKQFEPIPIYPLRMNGRFGMTWHICRHGFWSVFFYTLLFSLVGALLFGAALLPAALSLLRSDLLSKLPGLWGDVLSELPRSFDFNIEGADLSSLSGVLGSLGLLLVVGLISAFLLRPLYLGVIYSEMSGRLRGTQSSFGDLFKRTGACFKHYYSTYLTLIVGNMGVSTLAGSIGSIVGAFSSVLLLLAASGGFIPSILGAGVLVLISAFLGFAVGCFVVLLYPAAASENKCAFAGLGRSISLVWKNFGRVFLSLLLRTLLITAFSLPSVILTTIAYFAEGARPSLLIAAAAWTVLTGLFFKVYSPAFETVLHADCVARAERSANAQTAQPVQEQAAQEDAPVVVETVPAEAVEVQAEPVESQAEQAPAEAQPFEGAPDDADFQDPQDPKDPENEEA